MNTKIPSPSRTSPAAEPVHSGLQLDTVTEEAWMDVVHQMEEVYSDLIRYQVEIEQKNEELEEAQTFISSVLGSMTDVLIVCDQQGKVVQANTALELLKGETSTELEGRHFLELFTDDSHGELSRIWDTLRRQTIEDFEVHLLTAEGEPAPLSLNCTGRYDSRGRMLGAVLIGRPVGELRKAYDELNRSHRKLMRAQQQLVDSEKMASLGRLVAGVAHELNNPISFIYGNGHSLKRYCDRLQAYLDAVHHHDLPEEVKQLREELRIDRMIQDLPSLMEGTLEGAERVRDIVMDLRRFSSGQRFECTRFDLVHVIQTAVHWVTKESRIRLRIASDLPEYLEISGHPGHIQQVLINLVQNAVDVLQEIPAPRIELSLKAVGDKALFQIRDNGPGIPETHLSRIFEPFFTTKPVGKGTGLGLSLSYGLIADHGGNFRAENHPDGGALFTIELPLETQQEDRP